MNAPTMVAQYQATAGPSRYQAPLPPPPTAPLAPIRTDPSIQSGTWSPLSSRSPNHVAPPPPLNMNPPQTQSRPQQYARELPAEPESPSTRNPLTDLMDTEKVYVEQLTFVIRVRLPHVCGPSSVLTRCSELQRHGRDETFPRRNSTPCFELSRPSTGPVVPLEQ